MRISDVANQTGIPISTIRYYEKRAIIAKPGRNGRNRDFSQNDVRAILFVRDLQSLGLPLAEISVLVQNSWNKGDMAQIAAKHRNTVRERIESLQRVDTILSNLETCDCSGFAECSVTAAECKRDA